jgi:hypothetical protein
VLTKFTDTPHRREVSKGRVSINKGIINDAMQAGGDISTEKIAIAMLSSSYPEQTNDHGDDNEANLYNDPTSIEEALARPDANKWKEAMKEEWQALLENNTFKAFEEELLPGTDMSSLRIVDLDQFTPISIPPNANPIDSKWVLRTKLNVDGSTRYKARLVIRGFQQIKGIDFDETYAPVSKLTTFRMMMAMAAKNGWTVDHMDVVTAFLNPEIDRDNIYMGLPPGIDWIDPRLAGISTVRLKKALYGLKQAPRLWYEEINAFLLSIGFTQSTTDPNLYIQDGTALILYVDDILIAYDQLNSKSVGAAVKQQLRERFKMKDLGRVRRFLGIEVDENFNLSQTSYIGAILRRFRMENAKSATSPMDPNVRLDNPRCEDKEANKTLYLSMVGSLMYAALGTRPDLAFCVTSLSRHNSRPLAMHLTAAKRALRYLKSTANLKIHYDVATSNDESSTVTGFTDSDWAGNLTTRKSVGGCVFSIGTCSGPIHWHSKSQSVVALSTLEAEYIACSNATREALWLQRLEADFILALIKGKSHSTPVKIGCDNQGALKLLETGVIQAKTKHIDVKYHHTRDEIAKGKVAFSYVASAENPADILTKPLNAHKHNCILDKLYLKC